MCVSNCVCDIGTSKRGGLGTISTVAKQKKQPNCKQGAVWEDQVVACFKMLALRSAGRLWKTMNVSISLISSPEFESSLVPAH